MAYHGFYSEASRREFGTVYIYEDINGNEVEVTYVTENAAGANYHWYDKEYRGPVVKWLRTVSVPTSKFMP